MQDGYKSVNAALPGKSYHGWRRKVTPFRESGLRRSEDIRGKRVAYTLEIAKGFVFQQLAAGVVVMKNGSA
jgi:hypothetical protein